MIKVQFLTNNQTSSKDWFYILPGIAIDINSKRLLFYWLYFMIDFYIVKDL